MIIFGTRMFGKTDAVPGVFYVHTRFFHINFIPLVPSQTYLFVTLRSGEQRAIGIPTSGSSVCAAWLRYLSVISVILSLIFLFLVPASLFDEYGDSPGAGEAAEVIVFVLALFALACGFVYFAFRYSANASYERAIELCSHLGQYEPHYRRIVDAKFSKIDGVPLAEATILTDDDEEEQAYEDEPGVEITETSQTKSNHRSKDLPDDEQGESTMMIV